MYSLFDSNFISSFLNIPFEVVLAIIYIEFALSCFSSLKLYTFYFNVYI